MVLCTCKCNSTYDIVFVHKFKNQQLYGLLHMSMDPSFSLKFVPVLFVLLLCMFSITMNRTCQYCLNPGTEEHFKCVGTLPKNLHYSTVLLCYLKGSNVNCNPVTLFIVCPTCYLHPHLNHYFYYLTQQQQMFFSVTVNTLPPTHR